MNVTSDSEGMSLSVQCERVLRVNPQNTGVLHGRDCINIEKGAKTPQTVEKVTQVQIHQNSSHSLEFLIEYL